MRDEFERGWSSGRLFTNSGLGGTNSGRIAGDGVNYDRYDDESGYRPGPLKAAYGKVRMPLDGEDPEKLNGPVKVIRAKK